MQVKRSPKRFPSQKMKKVFGEIAASCRKDDSLLFESRAVSQIVQPEGRKFLMTDTQFEDISSTRIDPATDRPVKTAMLRGWKRKCPKCGSGDLLRSYLKVHDSCSVCDQELRHHRADDAPAYLTILLVGHLMAPALHVAYVEFRPEPLTLFTIFAVGCTGLSLYLLPRLKGAVVGFQWARRMHGFGKED